MSDHLDALERRGDELEAFDSAQRQARAYMAEHGTQELVEELRRARSERRRIRLGTINTLVLLQHIDRLEDELGLKPLALP